MATPTKNLQPGDRVSDNYFQECLRKECGAIARPPDEAMTPEAVWNDVSRVYRQNTRVFWVVFDEMIRDAGNELLEGSEISEMDLELLS